MNVRIFWVHAMKCMCAQTRPRFILSSERVFLGNGVWTHVNSKGKIPSTRKFPQRRIEPATLWTASPNTTNELSRPNIAAVSVLWRVAFTSYYVHTGTHTINYTPMRTRTYIWQTLSDFTSSQNDFISIYSMSQILGTSDQNFKTNIKICNMFYEKLL